MGLPTLRDKRSEHAIIAGRGAGLGCETIYLPTESNASEFRVKEGNIFVAAAGYRFLGVIAPTDEEFTVVDTDDGRFPPSSQIILLVKARC